VSPVGGLRARAAVVAARGPGRAKAVPGGTSSLAASSPAVGAAIARICRPSWLRWSADQRPATSPSWPKPRPRRRSRRPAAHARHCQRSQPCS